MGEPPRYTFHPLERRGLLFGLGAGQLATAGAGTVLALVVKSGVGGRTGLALAAAVVIGSFGAAIWTKDGRPLAARAVAALSWLGRRSAGTALDPAPTTGSSGEGRTAVPGIILLRDQGLPGEGAMGVIRDRRAGSWAGVIRVSGGPLSLLDPDDQARQLERWRQVLGSLCRSGSPVSRLQWVQRSWSGPAGAADAVSAVPDSSAPGASASYEEVRATILPAVVHHEAWVVLSVGGATDGAPSAGRTRAGRPGPVTLRRELRLLSGQLAAAGLKPGAPLDLPALAELIGRPHRADGEATVAIARPWPLALDDRWSCCRADGMWHVTFWIAEWPRVEVGPDFLGPLLLTGVRAALSVVMAPVPPDKAWREVRSARTADVADTQLRARAGFLASARRDREADGVERREEELADGHDEYRFSGYLTVSAPDPEQLVAACAEVEHVAQSCRLQLSRLYGRQREALSWTLPLGRGLR